jgi:hypothetical protein
MYKFQIGDAVEVVEGKEPFFCGIVDEIYYGNCYLVEDGDGDYHMYFETQLREADLEGR